MPIQEHIVDLSRLQFAVTALYHFLFVPLTLGLAIILGIMESIYVMTGKEIWKQTTKFWAKLFGINFAMGVATGVTMEFQFGTNWAYYSHYVGDIFGVPLAIEGLMAFFLESTFVGLMFFGWNKLSKIQHLTVTWLTALGANFSALWILIANGWMQNPIGAEFNFKTMRMELTSIKEVFFNEVAQAKFVHTVSAGYVIGALFVLSISSYYLLRKRDVDIALRSIAVAASFGLAASLSVAVLGDESGYVTTLNQKMKLAAIEGMWETEKAPAGFALFGIPNVKKMETEYEVKVPYLLGLIATRTFDKEIPGIKDLVNESKHKIRQGIKAYMALERLRHNAKEDPKDVAILKENVNNLGYALLLKKFISNPSLATEKDIEKAALYTVPNVPVLFWSFRIMVGIGIFLIGLFALTFYFVATHKLQRHKTFLKVCFYSLPLPWISTELGWIVAEYGRQPWAIEGILPTFLGVSSVSTGHVMGSLIGFVVLYTGLLIVDVFLMTKYIKIGPSYIKSK